MSKLDTVAIFRNLSKNSQPFVHGVNSNISLDRLSLEDNIATVYIISPVRLGLEETIDIVYNISPDRLGLEDNIDTVYNISPDDAL